MSDSLWDFFVCSVLLLSSAQDINSITLECCRPLWKLASVFFILFYLMFHQKRGQWINELYRFMSYRDHSIAILTNWAKDYALLFFPTCENYFVYFYYWKYTSKLCWFRDLIAWWFVTYVNGTLFLCLYWLITFFLSVTYLTELNQMVLRWYGQDNELIHDPDGCGMRIDSVTSNLFL